MGELYNPFQGTVLADTWYLKRKSPTGKVAHLIHPVTFAAICGAPHCSWEWVEEHSPVSMCQKCRKLAKK